MPTSYQPSRAKRLNGDRAIGSANPKRIAQLAARYADGEELFPAGERSDAADVLSPALRGVSGRNEAGSSDAEADFGAGDSLSSCGGR